MGLEVHYICDYCGAQIEQLEKKWELSIVPDHTMRSPKVFCFGEGQLCVVAYLADKAERADMGEP